MKKILLTFFCSLSLLYSCFGYCEEDIYIETEENKDIVSVSSENDNINLDKKEEEKVKKEKNKHQYDIEIYPYVSMRYTSTTIIES